MLRGYRAISAAPLQRTCARVSICALALGENDARFLETKVIRALKAIGDLVKLIFVQLAYAPFNIGLGLGLD